MPFLEKLRRNAGMLNEKKIESSGMVLNEMITNYIENVQYDCE